MPNTTHCMNCCQPKTPDRYYNEPHCEGCANAVREADQYIVAEKIEDFSQRDLIRQDALLRRRRHPMDNRPHPSMPFQRTDTSAIEARLADDTARHG